ncbi:protein-L-isoaspartate O-methyltransferase family protein [Candidatus Nanohalococcus occultus]|uniref:protein-L-isoaspartate(D-aspartate) O-methyltransferase n=1 Tax=Candidatus Nanohalococcus occultus TaxID=2978047 RepID=A0ABY8CJL7_9ARCH|nr:Protein-L-isoaspartate carboxylmethyltransferase [Candidatus Nanohaloarchaeota archaeon SVXNc]
MDSNRELVKYLERTGWLTTDRVKKAFLRTDRKAFVPAESRDIAYVDKPVYLSDGSTISAPHIVARITELAEIRPGLSVLEIGSGSGYQLKILSFLAGEVTGIEPVKDLVETSRRNLRDRENIEVVVGKAPGDVKEVYDRIIVSYGISVDDWDVLKEKLSEGGVMVGAVESNGEQRLRKYRNGKEEIFERVRFVRSR